MVGFTNVPKLISKHTVKKSFRAHNRMRNGTQMSMTTVFGQKDNIRTNLERVYYIR